MSDDIAKLQHTGFVSKSCRAKPCPAVMRKMERAAAVPQKKPRSQSAVYLAVRLGICVLLLCTVVALKLSKSEKSAQVLNQISEVLNDDTDREERPGRLRFVQIPSIIQVFAPSKNLVLPVEPSDYSLLRDETLLALSVRQGEELRSPCSGSVLKVGEDGELGGFVAISGANDTEYYIFGIEGVCVEKGQPLTQNSILGSTAGQTLYLAVYKSGSPENPLNYFDLGKLQ